MTLGRKFGVATSVLFAVIMVLFSIIYSALMASTMQQDAKDGTFQMRQGIMRILQMTDDMLSKQVRMSMKLLLQEVQVIGEVKVEGDSRIGGQSIPNLWIGDELQTGSTDFVDRMRDLSEANITLLAKQGNQFVRVATSIVLDGKRPVGTSLDSQSLAYSALQAGKSYYGMIDVLGTPYMTAYEPIRDDNGQVIGAFYVGYLADGKLLHEAIEPRRVLGTGFLALVDDKNRVLHHSNHAPVDFVDQVAQGKHSDWQSYESVYDNWKYRVISAYPKSEMRGMIAKRIAIVLSVVMLCAVLLLAVILTLLNKIVSKPVGQMALTLEEIAQGNLSVRLNSDSNDELGNMARSFNRMLERLQETIANIQTVAHQLAASATQLSGMATDTSRSISEQTSETEQIATAMNEMSATVQEVARSTEIAAENALDAQRFAEQGKQVAERSIQSIQQLAGDVEQAANVINELSVASSNITQVLNVIRAIAEQTNLLALNAAIEAARAGEHGRGFSVVADEVRSLASRTQHSTAEIQQMIERIQTESTRAVDVMQRGQQTARSNVELTRESGASLQTILQAVERISDRGTEIASAAEEQSAVAEEITRNIVRIRDIAEHNDQNAQESKQASDGLAKMARELSERIKFFRV